MELCCIGVIFLGIVCFALLGISTTLASSTAAEIRDSSATEKKLKAETVKHQKDEQNNG